MVCVHDFLGGEVSVKVGVMEFELNSAFAFDLLVVFALFTYSNHSAIKKRRPPAAEPFNERSLVRQYFTWCVRT